MSFNPSLPATYEYIHYSGDDISAIDLNRTYAQSARDFAQHTPNGLWLSITGVNDWERNCIKKNYRLDNLKSEFQIILKPTARILLLHNKTAYENFAKKYSYFGEQGRRVLLFRWDEIIKDFQGIAIPRLYPLFFGIVIWQKAWLCTSACIWDLQAVKKVVRLT